MSQYPLISITIPSYNHEKFVEECLDSVLAQDYPNKEIVIINDGSKDNTSAVIKNWIEKNGDKISITYVERENRGIPKTANELIGLAKGDYLVALASDDKLLPESIMKRYEFLRDNPQKLAVIGDCEMIDEEGTVHYKSAIESVYKISRNSYKTDEGIKEQILFFRLVSGPVLMVKKEIYSIIGMYDEGIKAEDYDSYLRMAAKNLIGFVDMPLGQYRQHKKNHVSNSKLMIHYFSEAERIILRNIKNFKGEEFKLLKAICYFRYLKYKKLKELYILEGGPDAKLSTKAIVIVLRFLRSIKNFLKNR
jgi:glycosyltransferase involved in cell wall biosynthesis